MCKTALKEDQVLAEENLSTDYSADTRLRFLGESQCQDDCRGCRDFSVRHVVAGGRLPRLHRRDPGANAAAYHVINRKIRAVYNRIRVQVGVIVRDLEEMLASDSGVLDKSELTQIGA